MLYVDKVRVLCEERGRRGGSRRPPPPPAQSSLRSLPQYRPRSLDKFELHQDVAENLQKLVGSGRGGGRPAADGSLAAAARR